jgi:phage terminase Nu1 subunit (DNA packaging protein)
MFGLDTRKQLAKTLGVSEQTIRRYENDGLPVIRRGQLRLYDRQKTRAWLAGELPSLPRSRGRPSGKAA